MRDSIERLKVRGAPATTGLGTAAAPPYLAHRDGVGLRVFAGETRPLLQGARLTAGELSQSALAVTLPCDNGVAAVMARGDIDLVIVGADRAAANGDTANKSGALGLAAPPRHFNIPCYAALPYSSIDWDAAGGGDIPLEERTARELTRWGEDQVAPDNATAANPAFDVTPHQLVTGLITERGLLKNSSRRALRAHDGDG